MTGGHDLVPVVVAPGSAVIPGLAAALDGSGPALLLVPPGPEGERVVGALAPLASRGVPADTAVVVATSGSTGAPKGVRLVAKALRYSARATHDHLGGPGQWLIAMSPTRVAGLQAVIRSQVAGVGAVAVDTSAGFTPGAFTAALARLEPGVRHYTSMVPAQLIRLLDPGGELDIFDAILLGGGPIPEGLVERAAAAGARTVRTYGMTETCGGCVYEGVPLPHVQVWIDDAGLIRINGPVLAKGYLGSRPAPAHAPGPGFVGESFASTDLGVLDGDGVLTVLGRADDVIVSGGVNVPAQAVEQVLAAHPGVREVAVVGRPDPTWGAVVVAVVVAVAPVTLAELRELATARLGAAYVPRALHLVNALPTVPSGKLDRVALRRLVNDDGGP
ncbi:MAG: AMP-binding enzyme [Sporichthyaceae bacterium]